MFMRRIVAAAALYFAIVFAAGFVFGPIRVLWLEPKVGAALAVLIEAPFLLGVMALAARWVPKKLDASNEVMPMLAMGLLALVFVLVAEFTAGRWLRGQTPLEQLGYLATPAGLVYAALLALFAFMPVLMHSLLDDDGL
jgi:hypothetical protein